MQQTENSNTRRGVIQKYFRYADRGDDRWFDLFTDDAELTFPKFGTAKGKDELMLFVRCMGTILRKLSHDLDGLRLIEVGDTIIVEGQESGEMADGTPFPDGHVSQGRFCSVFDFLGDRIRSLGVYTDPDFASSDTARIQAFRQGLL